MSDRARAFLRTFVLPTLGTWVAVVAAIELMRIQVALSDASAHYPRSLAFQSQLSLWLCLSVYLPVLGLVLFAEALWFALADRLAWSRELRNMRRR